MMDVTEYLDRDLRDMHRYKAMSDNDVDAVIKSMDGVFRTTPYPHQARCFVAGMAVNKFLLLLHPGTGKSKIALDIFSARRAMKQSTRRMLVVVPSPANVAAWMAEISTHQPWMTCSELPLEHKIPRGVATIATYARLTRMLCQIPKRKKGKWKVDIDRIDSFAKHYDFIVFDESTFIKNAQSLTTRIAAGLSWRVPFSAGMTGTPFGLDPCDLFSQFLVVDGGEALGKSVTMFRAAFAREQRDYFKGRVYRINTARDEDLRRAMRHSSIHYSLDECVSLPPITHIKREVEIGDDARASYNDLKQQCREAFDDADRKEVAGVFIRLCQIATGFRVDVDEETGERVETDFASNPKMDALRELLDEIPAENKVVIFHWFVKSGMAITEMLKSMGMQHRWLYSGTKDATAAYNEFRNNPDVRIFIVNPKSGGYGLNLQVANYAIFYESPVSPIDREQAVDRVYRTGQEKPVFIYDIVAKRTVEQHILSLVKEGKNALTAVLNGARGIV